MTYTLTNSQSVIRDADNAFIPFDEANTDYREYQAWLAEGNTPNPYVAPPAPPEPTLDETLASVGLSISDLKTALGLK